MMYHNLQTGVQVNGKRSGLLRSSRRPGRVALCLLNVLALEPLLLRLRDEKASSTQCGILFASPLSAKVSAYADDISVFVSCRLDIKAVKKVVARYEQIAGAKINFDNSKGLQLGAWRGGVPLPGHSRMNGRTRPHHRGVFWVRPPTEAK